MEPLAEDAGVIPSSLSASPAGARRAAWLRLARRAWPLVAGLAITAEVLALPAFARSQVNPTIRAELPAWHLSPGGYTAAMAAVTGAFTLTCLAVAVIVFFRAGREPVALFCAYMLVAFGCGLGGYLPGLAIANPVLNAASYHPDRRRRDPGRLVLPGVPVGQLRPAVEPLVRAGCRCRVRGRGGPEHRQGPSPVPAAVQPVGVGLLLLGTGAQIYRYRRVSALRRAAADQVGGARRRRLHRRYSPLAVWPAYLLTPAVRRSRRWPRTSSAAAA